MVISLVGSLLQPQGLRGSKPQALEDLGCNVINVPFYPEKRHLPYAEAANHVLEAHKQNIPVLVFDTCGEVFAPGVAASFLVLSGFGVIKALSHIKRKADYAKLDSTVVTELYRLAGGLRRQPEKAISFGDEGSPILLSPSALCHPDNAELPSTLPEIPSLAAAAAPTAAAIATAAATTTTDLPVVGGGPRVYGLGAQGFCLLQDGTPCIPSETERMAEEAICEYLAEVGIEGGREGLRVLIKVLGNVAQQPHAEKYRRLKLDNPKLKESISCHKPLLRILRLSGFTGAPGASELVLPPDASLSRLQACLAALQRQQQQQQQEQDGQKQEVQQEQVHKQKTYEQQQQQQQQQHQANLSSKRSSRRRSSRRSASSSSSSSGHSNYLSSL
ncbi:hypothetical protein ACSSS7_000098 [Eimeria intestinalis]